MEQVTDMPPAIPAIAAHYGAYLRAKTKLSPETIMKDGQAILTIGQDERVLTLIFLCRKRKWSMRCIEIRRGEDTASFTEGDLAKAIAAFLAPESVAAAQPTACGTSGPRTDAALRERRNTVVRV